MSFLRGTGFFPFVKDMNAQLDRWKDLSVLYFSRLWLFNPIYMSLNS
jgi:hypothetical protein